jgi:hypothetical protein
LFGEVEGFLEDWVACEGWVAVEDQDVVPGSERLMGGW